MLDERHNVDFAVLNQLVPGLGADIRVLHPGEEPLLFLVPD